jgi:uncharacterized protein (DUF305 family)
MCRSIGLALTLCIAAGVAAHAQSHSHGDAPSDAAVSAGTTFASQMMQAMDRMDTGMMAAKRNPDRDFAAMMIPHHQGAVDMAKIQLIYGSDPVMRRLAQAIIVEQQQEIELMQRFLHEPSASRP